MNSCFVPVPNIIIGCGGGGFKCDLRLLKNDSLTIKTIKLKIVIYMSLDLKRHGKGLSCKYQLARLEFFCVALCNPITIPLGLYK